MACMGKPDGLHTSLGEFFGSGRSVDMVFLPAIHCKVCAREWNPEIGCFSLGSDPEIVGTRGLFSMSAQLVERHE